MLGITPGKITYLSRAKGLNDCLQAYVPQGETSDAKAKAPQSLAEVKALMLAKGMFEEDAASCFLEGNPLTLKVAVGGLKTSALSVIGAHADEFCGSTTPALQQTRHMLYLYCDVT